MIHRCTTTECPFIGQRTSRSCRCHQTDEQVLRESLRRMVARFGGSAIHTEDHLALREARAALEGDYHLAAAPSGNDSWQLISAAMINRPRDALKRTES